MVRVQEGDGLLLEKGNLSLPPLEVTWVNQVSGKGNRVREKEWILLNNITIYYKTTVILGK